ncbi:HET-domain-containing protein, partial [Xylaria telfairii]
MRLINTRSLEFEEFIGRSVPKYAILSHTWDKEEVTFQDWDDKQSTAQKMGYKKILAACQQAQADDVEYLWVDTNCIDKKSSAELSEAINSMFKWYRDSSYCYVYLADFHLYSPDDVDSLGLGDLGQLHICRWFTRGWTLQELLAPINVTFFDSDWRKIGEKEDPEFRSQLSDVTNIPTYYLDNPDNIFRASVSQRMSWVARRQTTREEDISYCMLGIFQINMPLLYGEGNRAFLRLQEEIIRTSNDQTIFCWNYPTKINNQGGLLAFDPSAFAEGWQYYSGPPFALSCGIAFEKSFRTDYSLTNDGLSITLPILRIGHDHLVALLSARRGVCRVALILRPGSLTMRGDYHRLRHLPLDAIANFVPRPLRLCYREDNFLYYEYGLHYVVLLPSCYIKIRHVHSWHKNAYTIKQQAEEGRAVYVDFPTRPGFLTSQKEVVIIVLDVELTYHRMIDVKEISVVIVCRQLRVTPKWQVETVLRGALTEQPTEIFHIALANLQGNGGATDSSRAMSDRHSLHLLEFNQGDAFTFVPIDDKLLGEWLDHLQTLEEYKARHPGVSGTVPEYEIDRTHSGMWD